MDKEMMDIYNLVQKVIEKTAKDRERCEGFMKTAAPGEQQSKFDIAYNNLNYRYQRLATCADILNGRAYTVIERGDDLMVIKDTPATARMVSLAQKMGLSADFVISKIEAEADTCRTCGGSKWWQRGDDRICQTCHPEPAKV